MDFSKCEIDRFTKELSSKTPVPGGGGASALCGALAISLASMVGEYTVGKPKYADVEEEIKRSLKEADGIRRLLISLIDEDAKAFEPLSKAYALKSDDPDRDSIMNKALEKALEAPAQMVMTCADVLDIIDVMHKKGSKLLSSDAGCAAAICRAAMESAAMNVYINTKELKDRKRANDINAQIAQKLKDYIPIADRIVKEVTETLI